MYQYLLCVILRDINVILYTNICYDKDKIFYGYKIEHFFILLGVPWRMYNQYKI